MMELELELIEKESLRSNIFRMKIDFHRFD